MVGAGNEVLVVEDDAELRGVYDRVLSEFYSVSTAPTGPQAVETMTDDTDVVLLDRRLPDTDEATLVRDLKNRYHDCYVALVTAREPDADVGIDDYLVKPVTAEQLRATVDRLLSLAEYDAIYRELSQKRVERNVLTQETTRPHGSELERLQADIERLERELAAIAETVGETERGLAP